MQFTILREQLLTPLQLIAGIAERKQTLPILSNLLLTLNENSLSEKKSPNLSLLASDLEVELKATLKLESEVEYKRIAIPTRKMVDICRSIPEGSLIHFFIEEKKVTIKSGNSLFILAAFEADNFPYIDSDTQKDINQFKISQKDFRCLLEKTQFSMAQQDVRYYLNGLLLEASKTYIKAIATDGHRLAINSLKHSQNVNPFQIIIPRKAVIELLRLLDSESEEEITLIIGTNFLRVFIKHYIFTTRLIDGRFPSYEKVIPQANDKKLMLDKDSFKQSLSRVAILANAKSKGVCLQLRNNLLRITSHNNEQDKAEEEIITEYTGNELDIGLNVTYLLEVINVMSNKELIIKFSSPSTAILIEEQSEINNFNVIYVIMPMRV